MDSLLFTYNFLIVCASNPLSTMGVFWVVIWVLMVNIVPHSLSNNHQFVPNIIPDVTTSVSECVHLRLTIATFVLQAPILVMKLTAQLELSLLLPHLQRGRMMQIQTYFLHSPLGGWGRGIATETFLDRMSFSWCHGQLVNMQMCQIIIWFSPYNWIYYGNLPMHPIK